MNAPFLRIALLQINPTVGDLDGNADRILRALRRAESAGAALAVTPELALTGYPPEDLLLRKAFVDRAGQAVARIAQKTSSTALICGYPAHDAAASGSPLKNSAAVLHARRHVADYHKICLPNYGVFDELRYFAAGRRALLLRDTASGARIAVSICEDLWTSSGDAYFEAVAGLRPDVILNLSASPYDRGKHPARLRVFAAAARRTGAAVVCVNLTGGQDELVFDGRSFALDRKGRLLRQAPAFTEDHLYVDLPLPQSRPVFSSAAADLSAQTIDLRLRGSRKRPAAAPKAPHSPAPGSPGEVLAALEHSLKDYVGKNGFSTVGVAMSGGIDSALVAALAVRALGKKRVIGATLPSGFTSQATLADARKQAKTLGIRLHEIPISGLHQQFLRSLAPVLAGKGAGATEENLQARIRGTLMMALSNHFGFLLLATGNKSELATGYCTLYGDMAGGFAPIKDLTKTWVYRICREINRLEGRPIIPLSVIRRAPTAELKHGQKDQDTLPPYSKLDAILEQLVEADLDPPSILSGKGHAAAHVADTARRVYFNEYKRRQAPIGPKITPKAFGRDRRMPISQKYGETY